MRILASGLPLAVQEFGPWIAMNGIIVLGVFGLARFVPQTLAGRVKIGAIVIGVVVFLFGKYGAVIALVPTPSVVLGPFATLSLNAGTVEWLFRLFNSILSGPVVVGTFGVVMNHLLTRPELNDIPIVHHTLPRRDPDPVVSTNAAAGTLFYLLVVFGATGHFVVFP